MLSIHVSELMKAFLAGEAGDGAGEAGDGAGEAGAGQVENSGSSGSE